MSVSVSNDALALVGHVNGHQTWIRIKVSVSKRRYGRNDDDAVDDAVEAIGGAIGDDESFAWFGLELGVTGGEGVFVLPERHLCLM